MKVPILFPDEFHYGHIARSLADGDGATWNGAHEGLRALLYVFAVTPAWLVASGTDAYAVAKALSAVMCCLVAVPVWLLGRTLTGPRLALLAAALTLAGSWMATTGQILSENLAFPLATGALCAMVMTLRAPGSRWWIWALALAALATFARLQLGILFAVFAAALLVDAAAAGRAGFAARLRPQRPMLAVAGLATIAGVIVVFASGSSTLGIYASVGDFRPSLGDILAASAQEALALVVMLGVVPAVFAVAMALRPANWSDELSGPVLCVLFSAVAGFCLEAGWFVAGDRPLTWDIERYVIYAAPLAFIALTLCAAAHLLGDRRGGAGRAVVGPPRDTGHQQPARAARGAGRDAPARQPRPCVRPPGRRPHARGAPCWARARSSCSCAGRRALPSGP